MPLYLLTLLLLLLPFVLGGSECPPRSEIRPCICMSRPLGKKKLETTLVCHNMADDGSIQAIDQALARTEVDRFLLYDSFWLMGATNAPVTAFSSYRIRELEIVDTTMKNFGCPARGNCATTYVKRFSATNSSWNERTECGQTLNVNSWLSCTDELERLEISYGVASDWTLRPDFFPVTLPKLKELHMTHDRIAKIDRKTFSSNKFPLLRTLDLSHNLIRDLRSIFGTPMKIKHLDLSFNNIRSFLDFSYLPHLESLKLVSTQITLLLENEWHQAPLALRHLDLTGNDLRCDCTGFKWVNSTFHINANLLGSCSSPDEIKGMKLRKASRTLLERCDQNNAIGSRIKAKKG